MNAIIIVGEKLFWVLDIVLLCSADNITVERVI